jgi:hypothetical protein
MIYTDSDMPPVTESDHGIGPVDTRTGRASAEGAGGCQRNRRSVGRRGVPVALAVARCSRHAPSRPWI